MKSHLKNGLIASPFLLAQLFGASALVAGATLSHVLPVSAKVGLKGCIKWWHGGQKKWYTYKHGEVEIEWDGAGKDKTRNTGANGCYKAKVRNAYVGNGHDMNVQVYAKRKFKGKGGRKYWVRAYETALDVYPTYFESRQKHVNDNKTGTIDVNIKAGTKFYKSGNLTPKADRKYYHWNIATADIIGRYYDWASSKGFKQGRSVDVIAPAWAPGNSYFNIATNNINLVSSTNPRNSNYGGWQGWTFTVIHEGTHALHAHSSPSNTAPAAGIFQPTKHSLTSISNPQVGWTEGFAGFLPVAYLTDRGILGQYANRSYTGVLNTSLSKKVANDSFIENHLKRSGQTNIPGSLWGDSSWFNDKNSQGRGGAEGYVVGFLWDLYDSRSNTEAHPDQSKIYKTNWNRGLAATLKDAKKICQVEYTSPRKYRNLPSSNAAFANPWLQRSSDCLSGMKPISAVISGKMRNNVTDFGEAYLSGKSDAVQYEVLKAYMTNGMSGALPRTIRSYRDLSVAQKSTKLSAYPSVKILKNKPAPEIDLDKKTYSWANIQIPVTIGAHLKPQWDSSTCIIANNEKESPCSTRRNGSSYSVTARINRTDYCTKENKRVVGTRESSPTYVAIDDGVNPIAFRVANLCSTRIKASLAPWL